MTDDGRAVYARFGDLDLRAGRGLDIRDFRDHAEKQELESGSFAVLCRLITDYEYVYTTSLNRKDRNPMMNLSDLIYEGGRGLIIHSSTMKRICLSTTTTVLGGGYAEIMCNPTFEVKA